MNDFIIKCGASYITEGEIHMGVPPTSKELKDAKIFHSEDEAKSYATLICFTVKILPV